jgi:tetratricopeptide (TPR) repeat protein
MMRCHSHSLTLLITIAIAYAPSAHAQHANADEATAKQKFEDGRTAYRLGDFDLAITDWKAGYQLKHDPIFLYNIAQAYREKADFEHAIFFYQSYLKDAPEAPNRAAVDQRIEEMKHSLEEQKATTKRPPSGPLEPDKPIKPDKQEPPPPPPESGHGLKISGLVVGAAGAVAIGLGIVFGLSAQSAQSDIESAVSNHAVWTPDLQDKLNSGHTNATLANVGFAVGAVAVVTGGVLYYLGVRKDRAVQITPEVQSRAAGLTLTVRY